MEFNLVSLILDVRSYDVSALVRRLAGSGAAFASACRGIACSCPTIGDCRSCPDACDCGWNLVFGQELSPDPEALRRHQKPSLPFVFSFPLWNDCDENSAMFSCGLVVVGRAVNCLDMLLEGFSCLLSTGDGDCRGELVSVAAQDYQGSKLLLGEGNLISHPENLVILSASGSFESHPWVGAALRIKLLTPLRLVSHGRQLRRFEFCTFARNLLRRVSAMAHYYGQCPVDHDFKALSQMAEEVACDEYRFSWDGSVTGAMAGLTGYGSFSGNFTELLPFLAVGRYLHAGKGASFGFGAFDIEVE